MGAVTNLDLISSNADFHDSSKSNFTYFSSSLRNGLETFEKSLLNLLYKPACVRKLLIPFIVVGGMRVFIIETFAWSTSNLAVEILCPNTIPYVTIKWNFLNLILDFCLNNSEDCF